MDLAHIDYRSLVLDCSFLNFDHIFRGLAVSNQCTLLRIELCSFEVIACDVECDDWLIFRSLLCCFNCFAHEILTITLNLNLVLLLLANFALN
jgi:hypothetical protein